MQSIFEFLFLAEKVKYESQPFIFVDLRNARRGRVL